MAPNVSNARQNGRDEDELSYDDSVETSGIQTVDMVPPTVEREERVILTRNAAKDTLSGGCCRFFAHWKILLAGQGLSILLALSGAMSASMHFDCNVSAPTMQTALVFTLMSFHFLPIKGKGKGTTKSSNNGEENQTSQSQDTAANTAEEKVGNYSMLCKRIYIPWWAYALLALISAEATYLSFLAYKYTSLPSASLLDNTNIIAAMLGSRIILKRKYRATHIIGALICCAGVFFNVFSDFEEEQNEVDPSLIDDVVEKTMAEVYPKKVLGDTFAIIGGLLVGLCDVLIESIVKDHVSVNEYLGTVGIFGACIAFIQAGFVEKEQIAKVFAADEDGDSQTFLSSEELYDLYDDPYEGPRICPREKAVGLLAAYMFAQYAFNYSMARFLKESESALLTLSLLTADLYAVIFTIVAEKIPPPTLFYAAFVLVVIGVLVYEVSPSPLHGSASDDSDDRRRWQFRNKQDSFAMSNLSMSQEGSARFEYDDDISVSSHEII